ncbi:hypothetical protein LOTGIDRAFT_218864 [Lottia gigantea]|uniref:Prefoldin subunit 2 n=1 Tax=Lottia gigantea TaxID=225164 RepID=V4A887_LOTGI|nr:hypothetical protein LOTGIDRAFT_218864 [Lottia gigantea]ESO89496.1 hypothetical protein LOTGIDRAFT_218864 [Lottia gigantea]
MAASNTSKTQKPKSQEQVISQFNEMRQQQRSFVSKISEIEMDIKEHELVLETLREVDDGRKCYRMVGGVLVERTVKDVLPALTNNKEQMSKLVETLTKQLESKGSEINKFREEHNLKIQGEEKKDLSEKEKDSKSGTSGVLVANNS